MQNRAKPSVKLWGIDTRRPPGPNREVQRGLGWPEKTTQKRMNLIWVLKDGPDFLWQRTVGMTYQLSQE